jgi:hypothetical protein
MSPLNAVTVLNMYVAEVTLETSHALMSPLNDVAEKNM